MVAGQPPHNSHTPARVPSETLHRTSTNSLYVPGALTIEHGQLWLEFNRVVPRLLYDHGTTVVVALAYSPQYVRRFQCSIVSESFYCASGEYGPSIEPNLMVQIGCNTSP